MSSESKEVTPADEGKTRPLIDAGSAETEPKSRGKKKSQGKVKELAAADAENVRLNPDQLKKLMAVNPSLQRETADMNASQIQELLKSLSLADALTGVAKKGAQKDMASYKFWATQPVPTFAEAEQITEDGPVKDVKIEEVPTTPKKLVEGFEWVEVDLLKDDEVQEVYELLSNHYVEDADATFRFNYSPSFLSWALRAPGWRKDWHVGVRASQSRKLVAFISAIPCELRVRKNVFKGSEVNFLVVHKRLRDKRLAPVLIAEVTRRINLQGIFQAIYTAGVVLPTPVATCRYFHRSLDWEKLHEVGFSGLPPNSTKKRQVIRFKLPTHTSLQGFREMKKDDVPAVLDLLKRYLERFQLAQIFTREEVEHWLLHSATVSPERVVWSYVVESKDKKITDFISFYRLESTALKKNTIVRAAYLFYYASESAFSASSTKDNSVLRKRLNELVHDSMIIAKNAGFDVYNALTLMDNPLFLEEQKFGAGDGQLHFYLYNYRAKHFPGGIDKNAIPDEKEMGGVGVVML